LCLSFFKKKKPIPRERISPFQRLPDDLFGRGKGSEAGGKDEMIKKRRTNQDKRQKKKQKVGQEEDEMQVGSDEDGEEGGEEGGADAPEGKGQ
jgi:hypothetical protein